MIPFVRTEFQEITWPTSETFVDQDLTSLGVPDGATGIWVYAVNTSSYYTGYGYVRCNGSADENGIFFLMTCHSQSVAYLAVDANGVIETRQPTEYPAGELYLAGYTLAPVVMFTNAVDKSISTTGTYVECSVADECPGARAVLATVDGGNTAANYFLRMNGSSDNRYASCMVRYNSFGRIIGVDASGIFEQKTQNTYPKLYVYGYCPSYVAMHINAIDRSIVATGAWTDVVLTSGAGVGFIQAMQGADSSRKLGIRKNGSSEEPYEDIGDVEYSSVDWAVETDAGYTIEAKIETTGPTFYELGYAYDNPFPSAPTTLYCEGEEAPGAVTDTTPELSAVLNDDLAGDTLTHVAVQVGLTEGAADLWDSDWINIADCTAGERCADVSYAGTAIEQAGEVFYWRIRAKDIDGGEGEWSAWASFTMAPKPVLVTDSGTGIEKTVTVGDEFIVFDDSGAGVESVSNVQKIQTRGILIQVPAIDASQEYPGKDPVIEYDPNAPA